MGENPPHHLRLFDRRKEPQPPAALGASKNVNLECAPQELRQDFVPAPVAARSGKAACPDPTGEELPKLSLDEGGQALAFAVRPRLLKEAFEMLSKNAVKDAVLGMAANVRGRSTLVTG